MYSLQFNDDNSSTMERGSLISKMNGLHDLNKWISETLESTEARIFVLVRLNEVEPRIFLLDDDLVPFYDLSPEGNSVTILPQLAIKHHRIADEFDNTKISKARHELLRLLSDTIEAY